MGLSPDEPLYSATGMYSGGRILGRNEVGYRAYLRSTGRDRPNPGSGYCATALRQALGLPSLGDAYEWPASLRKRGWRVREGHVHPYDVVIYSNKSGSTYRGYSSRSGKYFGHVGLAVPDGSGGLALWSYLNGKWQLSRLGKGWIAMYPPGE